VLALKEIAQGHINAEILKEVDLPVIKAERMDFEPLDIDWGH
jgi:hypothetical protein